MFGYDRVRSLGDGGWIGHVQNSARGVNSGFSHTFDRRIVMVLRWVFGGCVSRSDSENRSARKWAAREKDAADIGELLDAGAG